MPNQDTVVAPETKPATMLPTTIQLWLSFTTLNGPPTGTHPHPSVGCRSLPRKPQLSFPGRTRSAAWGSRHPPMLWRTRRYALSLADKEPERSEPTHPSLAQHEALPHVVNGRIEMHGVGRLSFPVAEVVANGVPVAALGRDGSLRIFFGSGRRIRLADGTE